MALPTPVSRGEATPASALVSLMESDLHAGLPAGVDALAAALRERLGDAVDAIVLYGSTRRNDDAGDGLVDLLVLVRSLSEVHGRGLAALFNRLLPPNVYYFESTVGDRTLRCKYITITSEQFRKRTAGGLDSYFWARFTQPCRLVWQRTPEQARMLAECRARAACHFAREAAALGPARLSAEAFWIRAIRATYDCELRPEPPGSATTLVGRDPEFWEQLGRLVLPGIEGIEWKDSTWVVGTRHARWRWWRRRLWGRTLNVLRLMKAAGTFANGVDYLCWKLERHSGIRIEPTERMRRHPRLAAWGLLFRLIRSGALR
ncbi:MAG: hypothetical protein Kow0020_09700 [Wenzhouxiangellaceae bacterium]